MPILLTLIALLNVDSLLSSVACRELCAIRAPRGDCDRASIVCNQEGFCSHLFFRNSGNDNMRVCVESVSVDCPLGSPVSCAEAENLAPPPPFILAPLEDNGDNVPADISLPPPSVASAAGVGSDNVSPHWIENERDDLSRQRTIASNEFSSTQLMYRYPRIEIFNRMDCHGIPVNLGRMIVDTSGSGMIEVDTRQIGRFIPHGSSGLFRIWTRRDDEDIVMFPSRIEPINGNVGRVYCGRLSICSFSLLPFMIMPPIRRNYPSFIALGTDWTRDEFCVQNSYSSVHVLETAHSNQWIVSGGMDSVGQETLYTRAPTPFSIDTASLYDYIPPALYYEFMVSVRSCGCEILYFDYEVARNCPLSCLPTIRLRLWNNATAAVEIQLLGEDYTQPHPDGGFKLYVRPQSALGQFPSIGMNILQNTVVIFENQD